MLFGQSTTAHDPAGPLRPGFPSASPQGSTGSVYYWRRSTRTNTMLVLVFTTWIETGRPANVSQKLLCGLLSEDSVRFKKPRRWEKRADTYIAMLHLACGIITWRAARLLG